MLAIYQQAAAKLKNTGKKYFYQNGSIGELLVSIGFGLVTMVVIFYGLLLARITCG